MKNCIITPTNRFAAAWPSCAAFMGARGMPLVAQCEFKDDLFFVGGTGHPIDGEIQMIADVVAELDDTLTPVEFRSALKKQGVTPESVDAVISKLDAAVRDDAGVKWEYATSFRRSDPHVVAILGALGLDEKQMSDFFKAAPVAE